MVVGHTPMWLWDTPVWVDRVDTHARVPNPCNSLFITSSTN
ncbi:hypothetical protein F383_07913 [Gossypium arboreum]|uniref:Uncharacterized protein n=1 Tax=Gossypium arboreum TaxID=29729 RepID=A0A0B0NV90_GOSAR|nr:hypothetical protein F383_07913 [Gossypium arboreum]